MRFLVGSFVLAGLAASSNVRTEDSCASCQAIQASLQPRLSKGASVQCGAPRARWSEYDAPQPAVTVFVGRDTDVQVAVAYADQHGCPFLAQNGANGWAADFTLDGRGMIIDLSGLTAVTFDNAKGQATIGGGLNTSAVVDAAYAHNVRIVVPTCNCIGFLGATLGGGLSRAMGLYSLAADQLLAATVVLANGTLRTASSTQDPDLFYALKGAGPNFGIVTSATVRTYPAAALNMAWRGSLTYAATQLDAVVNAIQNLDLQPAMSVDLYIASVPGVMPPTPAVVAVPFYMGTEAQGRAAFAPLLALKPLNDTTTTLPYNQWNSDGDAFCIRGSRKPAYGASMSNISATSYNKILDRYTAFVTTHPSASTTIVLLEAYSIAKSQTIPSSTAAYPFRNLKYHAAAIPWYANSSLDGPANDFGKDIRDLWRSTDGIVHDSGYINFAHGDEPLSVVYGQSLPRLQQLKKQYDPYGRLNQWFPIH